MRSPAAVFAGLLLGLLVTTSFAGSKIKDGFTGSGLLYLCERDRDACGNYSMGVLDGAVMGSFLAQQALKPSESPRRIFCQPDGLSSAALAELVLSYLGTTPQDELSKPARGVLLNAYMLFLFRCT